MNVRRLQRTLWAAAKLSSERRFHARYDRIHRGDVLWEAWERVRGTDIRVLIAKLTPILRGWGNYFRTGNAADKFRQIDWYVVGRSRRVMIKKRGRNLDLKGGWGNGSALRTPRP